MALPYANAQSGDKALMEIQKILRAFGCSSFGSMLNFETGELIIQFERQGQRIDMRASSKGYAAAWLKDNPWSSRKRCSKEEHEAKALEIGSVAVYSVLRDWVKGQVPAASTNFYLIYNYLAFYAARQNCLIWAAFGPYGQHSGQHFHAPPTNSTCAISHP